MTGVYPLWGRDTSPVASEMIVRGFIAHLVAVDRRRLELDFAGRPFNHALLTALPSGTDPCGENGEFHTFVSGGPIFPAPIAVIVGRTIERDSFAFTDLLPD